MSIENSTPCPTWHWVKDRDFPENGKSVWAAIKYEYAPGKFWYIRDTPTYYERLPNDFPYDLGATSGFVLQDSYSGEPYLADVVCWYPLPKLPPELKEEK